MALRTDADVIDFIDCDAVKKAYSTTSLTLDAVLMEIERDENYDAIPGVAKSNAINHKEFITWREFLSYFNDYREIEERNKKGSAQSEDLKSKRSDNVGAQQDDVEEDQAKQFSTLMEKEMERRL